MKLREDIEKEKQAEARRFSVCLDRAGPGMQKELADRLGISHQAVSAMRYGRQRLGRHLHAIALAFGVDEEWLRTGRGVVPDWYVDDGDPEPEEEQRPVSAGPTLIVQSGLRELPCLGTVAAGDGRMFGVMDGTAQEPYAFKAGRAVVRVMGDSAYPVIYSGQLAIVEPERPIRNNNLVVLVLRDGRALVKRWCESPKAPGGGMYVSVNAGVDSPWIDADTILHRWPVVGVLFE